MRRDDRDDPFEEFFQEFERMMDDLMGEGGTVRMESMHQSGGNATHADIYEEDDQLRVVADLPGVDKSDIDITCDGHIVHVVAAGERREYDERIQLPHRVDPDSASARYNNGVLEVILDTATEGQSIDIS